MVEMVAKKEDRRKQRTKQLLRDALLELIVERGYEAVSIQDITERANVARTTFYLHYKDKEELLLSSMTAVYDELAVAAEKVMLSNGLTPDGTPSEIVVFKHVAENEAFYRVMLIQPGVAIFMNQARHYLTRLFETHIDQHFPNHGIPQWRVQLATSQEAASLLGIVCWWLEHDLNPDAETLAHLFYESGKKGIWQALGLPLPEESSAC
jgi:AcrR family transcriptional regulator